MKEDKEIVYVLKWCLSGALSNPNLFPVWWGKIPLGGPPTSAMRAAVVAPPLSRAGCPGQGLQGPWCHRGSTPASHNGEQAPSVKGNTPPAPRQLGKGFTLWISLKTLEFCSDEDAGSCGNVSFTEKHRKVLQADLSAERCLPSTFPCKWCADRVLSWQFLGGKLPAQPPYRHSRVTDGEGCSAPLSLCAQTLPPHTCLYMQIVCLLLTDECWYHTCPKMSAYSPLLQ